MVLIAGWASAIIITETGITISAAYLTEYWKTFLSTCWSWLFWKSSLEKAGSSIVVTGVAKKVISTTKFVATE